MQKKLYLAKKVMKCIDFRKIFWYI